MSDNRFCRWCYLRLPTVASTLDSLAVITPACWTWMIPPPRLSAEEIATELSSHGPDRRALRLLYSDMASVRFLEFHSGVRGVARTQQAGGPRCAICGRRELSLVDDHDHVTGLRRGYLCRGCNVSEGRGDEPEVFAMYRQRSPAGILGHAEYYVGRGWPHGWWLRAR
jgi:hypothetical protein